MSSVFIERGKRHREDRHRVEHHMMMEAEIGVVPGEKHGNLSQSSQKETTPANTLILDFRPPEL